MENPPPFPSYFASEQRDEDKERELVQQEAASAI